MNPVSPSHVSPFDRPIQTRDDAKLAAQRAFFQAAMGRTAAAEAPAAAAPAPAPITRVPDPAAPAPQKILRPGALLDIRV